MDKASITGIETKVHSIQFQLHNVLFSCTYVGLEDHTGKSIRPTEGTFGWNTGYISEEALCVVKLQATRLKIV